MYTRTHTHCRISRRLWHLIHICNITRIHMLTYACACTYVHTHTRTRIYTGIDILGESRRSHGTLYTHVRFYIHISTHTRKCICTHVYTYTNIYRHRLSTRIHVCPSLKMCIYVDVFLKFTCARIRAKIYTHVRTDDQKRATPRRHA